MKFAKTLTLAASCLAFSTGCSEATKTETKEALKETGEAISSAAEDTKENAAKVADKIEEGARTAKDKLTGESSEPAATTETAPAEPAPGTP